MDPTTLVGALGSALPALILAAVVSVVGAVVAGLALIRSHPNPALAALPVAVPLVAAEIVGIVALRGADPAHGIGTAVGVGFVALAFALPPVGIVALFAAVGGGRGPVRRWREAAVVLVAALVPAAVTVAGGVAEEDLRYPILRALIYVAVGVFASIAHLGADEDGAPTSPEAAAAGGAVVALVVGAGEASARALELVFLLAVMPGVSPEARGAYLDVGWRDVIAPAAPWHEATVGLGCAAGVVAIGLVARSRPPLWAALVLVAVAVALGRLGLPGMAEIGALLPAP